jgi:peptide chain release factor 1
MEIILLEIRAGEGGVDSKMFIVDMYKMYYRYCELSKIKMECLSNTESCIVIKINGENVMKKFVLESGIHRVQRVPETENRDRRHTSTIAVAVLPFISFDPQYKERDFKIECTMGTGPGGQHRNKTMSAVKITHIPSGINACIDRRCQHTNKQEAMAIVLSRLRERDRNLHNNNENKNRIMQIRDMGRGVRIRTYNFIQDRTSDERITKQFRTNEIMKGRLDLIYKEFLSKDLTS